MSLLPSGWAEVQLDAVASIRPGRTPRHLDDYLKANPRTDRVVPFFKVGDMTGDSARFMSSARTHLAFDELRRLGVEPVPSGTIVFPKAGGAIATNKKRTIQTPGAIDLNCMAIVPGPRVESDYLYYWFEALDLRTLADGSILPQISKRRVADLVIPLPPLDEQRRVVDILEDHLSRLDAASNYLSAALRRAEVLAAAQVWQLTHRGRANQRSRLDEVSEVRLGRQRSPANHQGERMRPYLRAANVDWNRLRLDDIKEMNFTAAEERTFLLEPGDILVVEASGSAAEVGKSAIYEGFPANVCFQNTLLRVRCGSAADPRFLQMYLLAEARAGRFIEGSRGVGINHVGRAKLAGLEVSLPEVDEQRVLAERCAPALEGIEALTSSLRETRQRSMSLRRQLLQAAFSGRLTGGSSDVSRVKELAGV